jgi:HAD superfamily hydrolase (TIGR01490 family)
MKKKLVLFDFDGTITSHDSLAEFLLFYKGRTKFLLGTLILSPVIALYFLKLIPNWKGKQIVFRWFWGGDDLRQFNARCREFSARILPKIIRPQAMAVIREYLKSPGTTVAVVSASAENWIGPWCDDMGIVCVATQLDVTNGKLTGNICGANCYGPEKVKRIEKLFMLSEYEEIVAYGDSAGDREMFAIAHQHHYKPFRIQSIETT